MKIWSTPTIKLVLKYCESKGSGYAKTLFKPDFPKEQDEIIKSFTKDKLPYFFQFAKDKEYYTPEKQETGKKSQVEEKNDSTVNRLSNIIPSGHINYKRVVAKVDYRVLMKRRKASTDNEKVIALYEEVSSKKRFYMNLCEDKKMAQDYFSSILREKLKESGKREDAIVDILIEYLYNTPKGAPEKSKTNLWDAYGHYLVDNIKKNTKGTSSCQRCLQRFKTKNTNEKYCYGCKSEVKKQQDARNYSIKRSKITKSSLK